MSRIRFVVITAALVCLSSAFAGASGSGPVTERILPPAPAWSGATRALIVEDDDPWITPSETTGLVATPTYDETMAYVRRLADASDEIETVTLGTSPEGRDIVLVVAARGTGGFSPRALRASGKPILFAQAGIHAGEIDGKDAGLMLLRDMTVGDRKRALLDRAIFLFVPIFSVDGHERRSPYSRINQRGPESTGWRTTSRNLNLNRDYAKVDTPEMRHMIAALNRYSPDLYLDLHVTDGVDYQYDITWGAAGEQSHSPATARVMEQILDPAFAADLEAAGHIPGPLIFAVDNQNVANGLFDWSASTPRFSDGYGAARHLPTILVENHSLKPYDQRVLGTYVLLESALRHLADHVDVLRDAVRSDRARRPATVPLAWTVPQDRPPRTMKMRAIRAETVPSRALGGDAVRWTGEPIELEVPLFAPTQVSAEATRPAAYWIPPAWSEVVERLEVHGIELERIEAPREVDVEMYRLVDPKIDPQALEGHPRVSARTEIEKHRQRFPAGSVRVSTDQPLGDLAMLLLEPASADSFFQWGFFLEVHQRTEYFDAYVMAPTADAMLEADPELAEAFEEALTDPEFAADPRRRLQWFYERSPYIDERWLLYPVGRETMPPSADSAAR